MRRAGGSGRLQLHNLAHPCAFKSLDIGRIGDRTRFGRVAFERLDQPGLSFSFMYFPPGCLTQPATDEMSRGGGEEQERRGGRRGGEGLHERTMY